MNLVGFIQNRPGGSVLVIAELDKQDQMPDKQDASTEEIHGLRLDMKDHMDMRFRRIEADLAELKEMKAALKEKGII